MNTLELCLQVAGNLACVAVGFIAGRNALKASIEKRIKKEIYEQGKIDGAFEFLRDSLFAGLTKR